MEIWPTQTLSPGACPRTQMEVTGSFFPVCLFDLFCGFKAPIQLSSLPALTHNFLTQLVAAHTARLSDWSHFALPAQRGSCLKVLRCCTELRGIPQLPLHSGFLFCSHHLQTRCCSAEVLMRFRCCWRHISNLTVQN